MIIVSELLGESFPIFPGYKPTLYHQGASQSCNDNPPCVAEHAEYSPWQFGGQSLYVPQLLHGDLAMDREMSRGGSRKISMGRGGSLLQSM